MGVVFLRDAEGNWDLGLGELFIFFLSNSYILIVAIDNPLLPLTSYLLPLTSYLLPLTSYLLPLTYALYIQTRSRFLI